MKKFLLPLMAMLVSMVACQKDNEGILKLEVEEYNTDAKLHLNSDDYAVWDNGDEVMVNGADYTVSVSGTSATLTGVASASTYTAIYPASWASTTGTLTYPETQTYRTNGTAQVIDAPMAAYSDGGTLKFHNLGSILAVNVSGVESVESIKVVADGTTKINGTCTISNITTDSPSLGAPSTGTSTTVLECNGVSVPTTGMTFYIALPPVSAKLTIIVDDGFFRYSKSQGNAMTFASSHGYNVPFDATTATADQYAPTRKQIWYKSSNGVINAFDNVGTLESNELNSTLGYYVATYTANVTALPDYCLQNNGDLTEVVLPKGVTAIGNSAFYECGSLNRVVLPYSLTHISYSAFWNCSSLQSIEIPNPNVKLANNVFLSSGIQTIILNTNDPFTDEDKRYWSYFLADNLQNEYDMELDVWYDDYYDQYHNAGYSDEQIAVIAVEEAGPGAEEVAWEVMATDFWSFNTWSASRINVYVPDVTTCTGMSFNLGYLPFMGTDFIYQPWQYLIDNNRIQLLPLSALPQ